MRDLKRSVLVIPERGQRRSRLGDETGLSCLELLPASGSASSKKPLISTKEVQDSAQKLLVGCKAQLNNSVMLKADTMKRRGVVSVSPKYSLIPQYAICVVKKVCLLRAGGGKTCSSSASVVESHLENYPITLSYSPPSNPGWGPSSNAAPIEFRVQLSELTLLCDHAGKKFGGKKKNPTLGVGRNGGPGAEETFYPLLKTGIEAHGYPTRCLKRGDFFGEEEILFGTEQKLTPVSGRSGAVVLELSMVDFDEFDLSELHFLRRGTVTNPESVAVWKAPHDSSSMGGDREVSPPNGKSKTATTLLPPFARLVLETGIGKHVLHGCHEKKDFLLLAYENFASKSSVSVSEKKNDTKSQAAAFAMLVCEFAQRVPSQFFIPSEDTTKGQCVSFNAKEFFVSTKENNTRPSSPYLFIVEGPASVKYESSSYTVGDVFTLVRPEEPVAQPNIALQKPAATTSGALPSGAKTSRFRDASTTPRGGGKPGAASFNTFRFGGTPKMKASQPQWMQNLKKAKKAAPGSPDPAKTTSKRVLDSPSTEHSKRAADIGASCVWYLTDDAVQKALESMPTPSSSSSSSSSSSRSNQHGEKPPKGTAVRGIHIASTINSLFPTLSHEERERLCCDGLFRSLEFPQGGTFDPVRYFVKEMRVPASGGSGGKNCVSRNAKVDQREKTTKNFKERKLFAFLAKGKLEVRLFLTAGVGGAGIADGKISKSKAAAGSFGANRPGGKTEEGQQQLIYQSEAEVSSENADQRSLLWVRRAFTDPAEWLENQTQDDLFSAGEITTLVAEHIRASTPNSSNKTALQLDNGSSTATKDTARKLLKLEWTVSPLTEFYVIHEHAFYSCFTYDKVLLRQVLRFLDSTALYDRCNRYAQLCYSLEEEDDGTTATGVASAIQKSKARKQERKKFVPGRRLQNRAWGTNEATFSLVGKETKPDSTNAFSQHKPPSHKPGTSSTTAGTSSLSSRFLLPPSGSSGTLSQQQPMRFSFREMNAAKEKNGNLAHLSQKTKFSNKILDLKNFYKAHYPDIGVLGSGGFGYVTLHFDLARKKLLAVKAVNKKRIVENVFLFLGLTFVFAG